MSQTPPSRAARRPEGEGKASWTAGRIRVAVLAVLALCALGAAGFWGIAQLGQMPAADPRAGVPMQTLRTLAETSLHDSPDETGATTATLRAGTIVTGRPPAEGETWIQVTAIDGTRGWLRWAELGPLEAEAAPGELTMTTRRVVVSTLVNLRAAPSLSSEVIGSAEGGTRLVADATVRAEGETWLRVPLNNEITVFLLRRFTTADDEPGSEEGFGGSVLIGVPGTAKVIANVQAMPVTDARVIRPIQTGEAVRVIGQTFSEGWWYVLRLADGSQGFVPREAIEVSAGAGRWVYPDGTEAPGPNVPQAPVARRGGGDGGGGSDPDSVPVAPEAEADLALAPPEESPPPEPAPPGGNEQVP